ncbi:elongation factor 1-alpha [Reticulomyxa filosa]|uniref:Elongation factor 1-alpha n=1 Tax=Reticulomyxa filosa TaxID=46433 RepID=X6MGA6_RETFI|nr:elongation factor 1-alpha [Reticulomyxa filosa]|eukprot:ETO12432.1 elongation factor 1-alpha [Reticulomyxa filosa]
MQDKEKSAQITLLYSFCSIIMTVLQRKFNYCFVLQKKSDNKKGACTKYFLAIFEMSDNNGKARCTLCTVGDFQSGKSTLLGNFLCELGVYPLRFLEKLQKNVVEEGGDEKKAKILAYPWLLDQLKEERDKKMTITRKYRQCILSSGEVTVMDTPGHPSLIKSRLKGIVLSSAILYVIDASKPISVADNKQMKAHLKVFQLLGVASIIFALNKFDEVLLTPNLKSGDQVYNEWKTQLHNELLHYGYKSQHIPVIAVSGATGKSLAKDRNKQLTTYKNSKHSFEFIIDQVYHIRGVGRVVTGFVCLGTLNIHQSKSISFLCHPSGTRLMFKSAEMHHQFLSFFFLIKKKKKRL